MTPTRIMASTASQSRGPPRGSGSSIQNSVSQQQARYLQLQPPAIALIIYPITLVIGSLYSLISPTARISDLEASSTASFTSDPNPSAQQSPVNYFARKDNIFNLYFVKIGWLWTTLAFTALVLSHPAYTSPRLDSASRLRRATQGALRYVLVTTTWILTTQWFFGPAIIDRSFRATGGRCENPPLAVSGDPLITEIEAVFTAAACKAVGGSWNGGHDVSGHVFMLVLASAFLTFEMLGASGSASRGEGEEAKEKKQDGHQSVAENEDDIRALGRMWLQRFVWAVVGLSWWMLLMTGIWFHTWLEKVCHNFIRLFLLSLHSMFWRHELRQDSGG